MVSSLKVSEREGGTAVDIPLEDDGTLLSSRLEKYFNASSGLRFRTTETKTVRGLRSVNGKFYPPEGGWEICVHFCGDVTKYSKRKAADAALDAEHEAASSKKVMRSHKLQTTDLIILGLKKDTTEEHIRECFGKFGELQLVLIKRDKDGVSKGFGFIRFATYASQKTVLGNDSKFYLVNGRWCEVKIPISRILNRTESQESKHLEYRIFVGCCSSDITPSDLSQYFSKFGEVTHVYVPTNRAKPFAFVTFKDPSVVQRLLGEDHNIKGNRVNVRPAEEKPDAKTQCRSPNFKNAQTNNSTIVQNTQLTNEKLAYFREILERQDTDKIDRLCQTHIPCFYTNMMSTKLTLTSLVKIIQSQGHLLPQLVQSAAKLAHGLPSTCPKIQAQPGPSSPYQGHSAPDTTYQAQQGPSGLHRVPAIPDMTHQAYQGASGPCGAPEIPATTHQSQQCPNTPNQQLLMDQRPAYFKRSQVAGASDGYYTVRPQRGSAFGN